MTKNSVAFLGSAFFLVLFLASTASPASMMIQIDSPAQGTEVSMEVMAKGKASGAKAKVYVLVHPLRARSWWVQQLPAPPNRDGSWQTLCVFGTPTSGLNEDFQIIAIVTHHRYKEGQMLDDVPSSLAHSEVVTVKRTQ
jgi:hypothetical protein